MNLYTIGKLAALTGIGKETVRFYERRGLLPEPSRNASRYRMYSDDDVRLIQFIRRAKDLGFTLREIKQLIDLRADAETGCGQVLAIFEAKIASLQAHMRTLSETWIRLVRLAEKCSGDGAAADCPLLSSIG